MVASVVSASTPRGTGDAGRQALPEPNDPGMFGEKTELTRTGFSVPVISVIQTSGLVVFHMPWFEKTSVSIDLVVCFDQLCGVDGDNVSWFCVPPGLFYRDLLPLSLSDLRVLDIEKIRFDVSEMNWLWAGDWVRYGPGLMMSDVTGDGDVAGWWLLVL